MVVLEGNGSRPSHKGDGWRESEVMYTLNTTEVHAVCYSELRFFEWHEDTVSPTIRFKGGSYGGGSEVFVVESDGRRSDGNRVLHESAE